MQVQSGRMYTLRRGASTVSYQDSGRHYVIGFKNVNMARNVHYSMHPEPNFKLERTDQIGVSSAAFNLQLIMNPNAKLYIPKFTGGSIWDSMNDGSFHLDSVWADDFVMYPFTKGLGIIMPYLLEDEDKEVFVFKSCVVDPSFQADFWKAGNKM